MPGITLPNMSMTIPATDGDSGAWDDILNTAFGVIDEHDHTAGKGLRVPSAGIDIDADLPFGGNGITTLGRAAFSEIAALSAGARILYVNSTDHELYWRTNSGVNVKLTSGGSINTSLVGGIAGDYTAVGAELAYDDANDAYTFKQSNPGSGRPWARVAASDVRIYEHDTTESLSIALRTPAALAGSYDITLPVAAPGSTSVVLMDSSGNLSVATTIPGAITFSTSISTPTIAGTPNFTGAVTMASTLGVTGVATFTAAPTAPNYKYTSTQTILIPAMAAESVGTHVQDSSGVKWFIGTETARLIYPIVVRHGDRIVAWRLYADNSSGAGTLTARLYRHSITAGTPAEVALGTASTLSGGSGEGAMANVGLSIDVDASVHNQYYVAFEGGGTTGDYTYHLEVDVQRP